MDRSLIETQGGSSTRVDKQVDGGSIQEPRIDCHDPVPELHRGDIAIGIVQVRGTSTDNSSDEIPLTAIQNHHNFRYTE